jgi:hypothetical protein
MVTLAIVLCVVEITLRGLVVGIILAENLSRQLRQQSLIRLSRGKVHIPANVNTQSGHREHLSLPTHHEAGF